MRAKWTRMLDRYLHALEVWINSKLDRRKGS